LSVTGSGGVTQLISGGSNVVLDPTDGLGAVTLSVTGGASNWSTYPAVSAVIGEPLNFNTAGTGGVSIGNTGDVSIQTSGNLTIAKTGTTSTIGFPTGDISINAKDHINLTAQDQNIIITPGGSAPTTNMKGMVCRFLPMTSGISPPSPTPVFQPVIQYGTVSVSGPSGSEPVSLPASYSNLANYVVQVTMQDAPAAQVYATPTSFDAFTIGWSSAGAGTHVLMWTTFGDKA
jgi:hypothetical protein